MHSFFWCNKTLVPLFVCIVISNLIQIGVSDCSTNSRYCDRFTREENRRLDDERFNLNRKIETLDSRRHTDRDDIRGKTDTYTVFQQDRRNEPVCESRIREDRRNRVIVSDNEINVLSRTERDAIRSNSEFRRIHKENVRDERIIMKNDERLRETGNIRRNRERIQDESRNEQRRLNHRNHQIVRLEKINKLQSERRIDSRNTREIRSDREIISANDVNRNIERRDVREDNQRRENLKRETVRSIEENRREPDRRNIDRVDRFNRRQIIREENGVRSKSESRRDNVENIQRRQSLNEIRARTIIENRGRHVEDRQDTRRATLLNSGEERSKEITRVVRTRDNMRNIRTRDTSSDREMRDLNRNNQLTRRESANRLPAMRLIQNDKTTVEIRRQPDLSRNLHRDETRDNKRQTVRNPAERRERDSESSRQERTEKHRTVARETTDRRNIIDNRRTGSHDRLDTARRANEIRGLIRVERVQIDRGNGRSAIRDYRTLDSFASTTLKSNMLWYMLQLLVIGFVTLKLANKPSADCKKTPFLVKLNSSLSKLKIF